MWNKEEGTGEAFGYHPPTYARRVRNNLKDYRDLQIPKELIQNADDAGATEMDLILDTREFGTESLQDPRLSVCQGPALVSINNGTFSEIDWLNIQNFSCSTKENEGEKIGRFGLGFSSVYHLTDFAWIFSGSSIAVIDPRKTGIFMKKDEKEYGWRWKFVDPSVFQHISKFPDQFAPFPITERLIRDGKADFTYFRFPLRRSFDPNFEELSRAVYTSEKIEKLFRDFMSESKDVLLFLKNLKTLRVYKQTSKSKELLYSVEKKEAPGPQQVKVVKILEEASGRKSVREWAVARWLLKDSDRQKKEIYEIAAKEDLRPEVGVAILLSIDGQVPTSPLEGSCFCFLPLSAPTTGLPVHVNGYFAVQKNRGGLVLESGDDEDRRAEWNRLLISELLPKVYLDALRFVRDAVKGSDKLVPLLFPKVRNNADWPWKALVQKFYALTANEKIIWSDTGFLAISDAVRIPEKILRLKDIEGAVTQLCSAAKLRLAKIEDHIVDNFERFGKIRVTVLNADMLSDAARHHAAVLDRQNSRTKLHLLDYFVDNLTDFRNILGVRILPLQTEEFVDFKQKNFPAVFLADANVQKLLPNLNHRFSLDYGGCLRTIARKGITQLKIMEPSDFPNLLKESLDIAELPLNLLNPVWFHIYQKFPHDLSRFNGLKILPTTTGQYTLLDSNKFLLSSAGIDSSTADWLKKLALKFITLQRYEIYHPQLDLYVHPVTGRNILQALSSTNSAARTCDMMNSFPISITNWLKQKFSQIEKLSHGEKAFLSQLPLFSTEESKSVSSVESSLISAAAADYSQLERKAMDLGFPALFSELGTGTRYLLKPVDSETKKLYELLGVKVVPTADLLGHLIERFSSAPRFTDWIIERYRDLDRNFGTFQLQNVEPVLVEFDRSIESKDKERYAVCCQLLANHLTLSGEEWCRTGNGDSILCSKSVFHRASTVVLAIDSSMELCPVVCQPSTEVPQTFLEKCSVKHKASLTAKDYFGFLEEIRLLWDLIPLDIPAMQTVRNIFLKLQDMNFNLADFDIYLPDAEKILRKSTDLVFAVGGQEHQCPIANDGQSTIYHLHKDFVWLANKYEINTNQDVTMRMYGKEFGQRVELIPRIQRVLEQYHGQMDLVNECVQNADDARASKIFFILDEREHCREEIFSDAYQELQGPSLLIYNDATFTNEDLIGIQRLGIGSKADDAEKIGRYGAGFNCVYRLTDCPSFISNDSTMCIFDPLHKFVAKTKELPGRQYETNADFKQQFSGVYQTYIIPSLGEQEFPLKGGTIFRLPLRKPSAEGNAIWHEAVTASNLSCMLENPCHEKAKGRPEEHSMRLLLFLKNLREIGFLHIGQGGAIQMKWHVFKEQETLSSDDGASITSVSLKEVIKSKKENWIVSVKSKFGKEYEKHFKNRDISRIHLHSVGAVARRVDEAESRSTLFCGLPLPWSFDLPVCINGHFVLEGEGRKNLFTTDDAGTDSANLRKTWNKALLNDICVQAYIALIHAEKLKIKSQADMKNYWHLFPHSIEKLDSTWQDFGKKFYAAIGEVELLPLLSKSGSAESEISYTAALDGYFPDFKTFQYYKVKNLLANVGMPVIDCPAHIFKGLQQAGVKVKSADPENVAAFLRNGPVILPADFPCHISSTVFDNPKLASICLEYVLTPHMTSIPETTDSVKVPFEFEGLPLLVTADGSLRRFSSQCPIFVEEKEVVELFERPDLFLDNSLLVAVQKVMPFKEPCLFPVFKKLSWAEIEKLLPDFLNSRCTVADPAIKVAGKFLMQDDNQKPWLRKLWQLLSQGFQEYKDKQQAAEEFLQLFGQWCLLPVSGLHRSSLFPICYGKKVLRPYSLSEVVGAAADKLCPVADISSIMPPPRSYYLAPPAYVSVIREMVSLVMAQSFQEFAEALLFWHQQGICKWPVDKDEMSSVASRILMYFDKCLQDSGSKVTDTLVQTLRSLPLFQELSGSFISLKNHHSVYAVPNFVELPLAGKHHWMADVCFISTSGSPEQERMLKHLAISTTAQTAEIYWKFIIPKLDLMTSAEQIYHLEHLRKNLFENGHSKWKECLLRATEYCSSSSCIRCVLAQQPFVQVSDVEKRRICDFYDANQNIFKHFLTEDQFIPKDFWLALIKGKDEQKSHCWLRFLIALGLKQNAQPLQLVKFAEQLAAAPSSMAEGHEETIKKWKLILGYLGENFKKESKDWIDAAKRIAAVKFIPAQALQQELLDLYPMENPSSLLCLQGTLTDSSLLLVWTMQNVLPKLQSFPKELKALLGMQEYPQLDLVLDHCRRLFGYLQEQMLIKHKHTYNIQT